MPELATAAALVPAYTQRLIEGVLPQGPKRGAVVFIVCGGTKVCLKDLEEYGEMAVSWDREADIVNIDGGNIVVTV